MTPDATLIAPSTFRRMTRARPVLLKGGALLVVCGIVALFLIEDRGVRAAVGLSPVVAGILAWVAGLGLLFWPAGPRREPRVIGSPVAGRWMMVNSPGSAVPSHGVHSLAQTFAVDMVLVPGDAARGERGEPGARGFVAPGRFPSFGVPICAPAAGRVVAAHGRARDHLTRTGPLGLAYMFAEAMLREVAGRRAMFGNHVILDLDDGVYAVLAHLRRNTLRVRAGDEVQAGQQLAECGNSGNSSEPHLHVQLMDGPAPRRAVGVPFLFGGVEVEGAGGRPAAAVPANERTMLVLRPPGAPAAERGDAHP